MFIFEDIGEPSWLSCCIIKPLKYKLFNWGKLLIDQIPWSLALHQKVIDDFTILTNSIILLSYSI